MYLPNSFRIDDRAAIADFMVRHNFVTLVTTGEAGMTASHLPLLIRPEVGEHGALVGHLARANPQWKELAAGRECLAIFHGPHAYVSPNWYTVQPAVPTWNYAVVHAYGKATLIEDEAAVRAVLRELTDIHEAGFERPWTIDKDPEFVAKLSKAIVAFEIRLTRVEAKFKLSQNRSAEDRAGVIAALENGDSTERQTAAMMKE